MTRASSLACPIPTCSRPGFRRGDGGSGSFQPRGGGGLRVLERRGRRTWVKSPESSGGEDRGWRRRNRVTRPSDAPLGLPAAPGGHHGSGPGRRERANPKPSMAESACDQTIWDAHARAAAANQGTTACLIGTGVMSVEHPPHPRREVGIAPRRDHPAHAPPRMALLFAPRRWPVPFRHARVPGFAAATGGRLITPPPPAPRAPATAGPPSRRSGGRRWTGGRGAGAGAPAAAG